MKKIEAGIKIPSQVMQRDFSSYSTEHHKKVGPDLTRPRYRDGKKKTAVKLSIS